MRIVLVIFISTHDSLSSPRNHSAVVTSVIIRALTQETICQIQNSSRRSSLTTLWNNICHNYGVNSSLVSPMGKKNSHQINSKGTT